ncbi:MAG: hypothetical protein P9M13_07580 [Candidatus Ancaeobacter aquaticus]|nr:hypothetical protein [Candidatus Ancaeobacter aquaticus]
MCCHYCDYCEDCEDYSPNNENCCASCQDYEDCPFRQGGVSPDYEDEFDNDLESSRGDYDKQEQDKEDYA